MQLTRTWELKVENIEYGLKLDPELMRVCLATVYYIGASLSSNGVTFDDKTTFDPIMKKKDYKLCMV